MKTHKISGYDIYDYIVSGAKRIIKHEKVLNDINVFPIADCDTGSNLAYTMKCIIAKSSRREHLGETLSSISQVASEDSFGNSGTIFASYLSGFASESRTKSEMTTSEFAIAASVAAQYAYGSVAVPEEGTILTVMREWSDYLVRNAQDFMDIKELLTNAMRHAEHVMERTKTQLKSLRDADVVDAGALGFIYFLEGILDFIDSKSSALFNKFDNSKSTIPMIHDAPTFKYCCEFLVEGLSNDDYKYFKKLFSNRMDSVVIHHNDTFTKLHCHTDQPQLISDFIASNAYIVKSKVDDMKLQIGISNYDEKSIGIITDTIADIPDEWIEKYKITRIPLHLIIGNNAFVDRYTINSDNLYDILDKTNVHPTSGQPGDMYISKTLEFLLSHYETVIGIFVSSKMSGLFDKVKRSAHALNASRLHVFDSKNNSASQGLMVYDVIKMIDSDYTSQDIIETLQRDINKYHIHVEIPDLSYATRSGRVPKLLGNIADLLRLKVVISINRSGKGIICKERSLAQIIKNIEESHDLENYAIVHSDNPTAAKEYAAVLEKITGKPPLFINEVSSVVAAFVGRGAIGIGYKDI